MGKVVQVKESERKYTIDFFSKEIPWEREFLIYQWYDKNSPEYKIKCIFDLLKLTTKWVTVKKERISNEVSQKTVTYLNEGEIDLVSLVGWNFVSKRRSLIGEISVDSFIRSNGACRYLLENEGNENDLLELMEKEGLKLKEVTDNPMFRNTNMTTEFTMSDYQELIHILQIIHL